MLSNFIKFNISLLLISIAGFSFGQSTNDLVFDKSVQKFKKVDEGHQLSFTYLFTNTSKNTFTLTPPEVDCNCTEVIIPENNILPNSKDSIIVKFDTKDKIGYQERDVILKFISKEHPNSPVDLKITFKGVVKATQATKEKYKKN